MKIIEKITSRKYWKVVLAIVLTILAAGLYLLRWDAFNTPALHNEMLRYLVDDLAFLFVQILLVTVFLETYLNRREQQAKRQKLNMIIGAFFSETGFDLLHDIVMVDAASDEIQAVASPQLNLSSKDFDHARASFAAHVPSMAPTPQKLTKMNELLFEKKNSILSLLTNQALLDHESFTDLLWSISHLTDELSARGNFDNLPATDITHLGIDMARTYGILGIEWLNYLEHLQGRYPYLYSLAVRNNPLNPYCVIEVCETNLAAQQEERLVRF